MAAVRNRPLGLLGWLLTMLFEWTLGDSAESDTTRVKLA